MFVLLLKGTDEVDEEDRYERVLHPTPSVRIPVLKFEVVEFEVRRLESAEFDAIITTSARAAWAVSQLGSSSLLDRIRQVPWYCVGQGSKEAAVKLLEVTCVLGSETGSAENLINLIENNPSIHSGKIAYLSGNLRKSTIGDGLDRLGIKKFTEYVVYRTIPNTKVSLQVPNFSGKRVCAFFSPSGVSAVGSQVGQDDVVVAIGETTSKALLEAGIHVNAVAATPSPEGLLTAIQSCT